MPLRFLVKTATTVSVVFHSFPMCFSSRCYCGTRAESRWCHCGHGDPIELPLRFDGGATAIIGGSTAGPVRCHCGAGGATGVALRQQGGSMTSARRLDKGGGFRSNSLQFSLLLRTLLLLLRLLLLSLVMPPKRATRGVGKAIKTTPTPTPPDVESSHDEHDDGAAGVEDAAESDRQSAGSQPKKTKVRSDLTDEEEEAMADWLGDHPELYNKKLNAYKDKVKKDAAWAEQAAYFSAIAWRLYCGGTAVMEVLLRCLYGVTAVMAVPWRSHCGLAQLAVARRKF